MHRVVVVFPIAVILSLGMTAAAQAVSIQFDGSVFKVTGWKGAGEPPNGWASIFNVYAAGGDVPPLLGTYSFENGALTFHPRFPIAPGVHYRAVFKLPGSAAIAKTFDGPRRDLTSLTRVERLYPSSEVLPSNLLRLYVYFSAPMSRGEAAQRIHFLDENGKALEGTEALFLPGEELWDPSFKRLTMTFDPGRIKRGLTSNQSIGPPIAEGKRYTLVIDRDWPDARGATLVEGFRKQFRGGSPQRTAPDPNQWHVTPPTAATSGQLLVDFPTPMNYPLLQRMLQVSGTQGRIEGTVNIDREETRWHFVPRNPWKSGDYRLVVDTGIEDLAGNHIGQLFDIDVFDRVTEHISSTTISIPFKIR